MLIDGYVAEQMKTAMLNSEQEQVKIYDAYYNKGYADAIDELLNKINEEVDMWWNLEKENSEDDANWYTSIKMLLKQLKENDK